ncbi:aliphatic sulfonate ABC transporter substrate-binding protein [Gryllotalpicola ginsengisoli]|uniref:aliphatic sulfonate ABC transporter substrate-binding protein n=1 Tax=Gryllotalpicola ginsengisoli TaxID=444608 RepID=UPI0003B77094|nr:aliphatic sulfonate ABC transporter substrate-binding protein [Gryllotalpicola ginsengisoli]
MTRTRTLLGTLAAAAATALLLTGCVAGEDAASSASDPSGAAGSTHGGTLTIDYATYNPLSLVIKQEGWLEDALKKQDITVKWVQSTGSSQANQLLRSGSGDVASSAGSAAVLNRANGSPIKVVDVYSQPDWSAIVVGKNSNITSVAQLKGKKIAAQLGTDPYFFLLQALQANGLSADDVTIVNLAHADGWSALQNGSVDAWSGLDPIMANAQVTAGAKIIYDHPGFNSYGALIATESFLKDEPDVAQTVVDAYEHARRWAEQHPDDTVKILADVAQIDPAVAKTVITDRTNLEVSGVPGEAQLKVWKTIGPTFVKNGDVPSQDAVDTALDSIIDDSFAKKADPEAIGGD